MHGQEKGTPATAWHVPMEAHSAVAAHEATGIAAADNDDGLDESQAGAPEAAAAHTDDIGSGRTSAVGGHTSLASGDIAGPAAFAAAATPDDDDNNGEAAENIPPPMQRVSIEPPPSQHTAVVVVVAAVAAADDNTDPGYTPESRSDWSSSSSRELQSRSRESKRDPPLPAGVEGAVPSLPEEEEAAAAGDEVLFSAPSSIAGAASAGAVGFVLATFQR